MSTKLFNGTGDNVSHIRLPISPKSTFLAGTALKNTVVVILSVWFEFVVVVAVAAETEATTAICSFHCLSEMHASEQFHKYAVHRKGISLPPMDN